MRKILTTTERLTGLPLDPSPAELQPLVNDFAAAAARARYADKSIAASLRCVKEVRGELENEFARRVRERLAALRQATPTLEDAPAPGGRWLTDVATAHVLVTSLSTVRGWLLTADGRLRLGWPWWDGRRWYVPEPALNPETRAAYMATVPLVEPPAIAATLPAGCELSSPSV